jgi:hypothetical protein
MESFTVRILQKDIPDMMKILTAIPENKTKEMRARVDRVWQR